ncbi:UNVERIFIED_ORG: hypothetical protein ABIB63_001275 [Xanthomonas axonopodis]
MMSSRGPITLRRMKIGQAILALGRTHGHHQVGGTDEAGFHAGLGGQIAQADRQVGFADAGGTQQHQILGPLDERKSGQFLHCLLAGAMGRGEVELLQGLDHGEAGHPGQHVSRTALPCGHFIFEQSFQEIGEAQLVAHRFASQFRVVRGHRLQLQLATQFMDALMLQLHQCTSGNNCS